MIYFNCFECHNDFGAEHFNLARITIPCPVCETQLDITQSLTRAYGKTVGEQVAKIMKALEQVAERGKESMATMIESAYGRIVKLCEEAIVG
jgi:hypothetical protein